MNDLDSFVLTELEDGVMTITLDRPKVNALNLSMIETLMGAFRAASRDPQIRCVLLTARGPVFSAGQDLAEAKSKGDESYRFHLQRTYNPLVYQIRQLEKPVLAAVNGAVSGAARCSSRGPWLSAAARPRGAEGGPVGR